jgi:multidrug efflux pump subunit AcrA (membrane-fusion protein)
LNFILHLPSTVLLSPLLLAILVAACNPKSEIGNPKSVAVVLPQVATPTLPPPSSTGRSPPVGSQPPAPGAAGSSRQEGIEGIVEVRVTHVQDLAEVLVHPGDQVQAGQVLAMLSGYAEDLDWDVQRIRWELTQAQAKLADAQAGLAAARQEAAASHEQQVADAADRVTTLERRVSALQRRQQIAEARLAEAQATTEYRRRWLDILEPLDEYDPWGDLPYLVGSQNGPKGPRSDLAYREAMAKARYDLHQAELAQQIAELQATDAAAQLKQAQADLEAARTTLDHLQASHPAIQRRPEQRPEPVEGVPPEVPPELVEGPVEGPSSHPAIYESSVRINELRLAQAQAEQKKTVVKSLVAGQVLEVQIDRVDGNEATVIIRITAAGR